MLYTIVGDPHAKPSNLDYINKLFDIIEDLGNPCIILGDLLDTKELIRGKCLNTYFDRMSSSKLNFVVLVGNHDFFNKECEDHSLRILDKLENVTVIDSPRTVTLSSGIKALLLPYIANSEKFKEALKIEAEIVFCHADINGFDYGNGHIAKHSITLEDFSKYPLVISGHYHKFQEKKNLIYLGTPFSHSFGESDQDKYIALFDSSNRGLKLLKTPFPQHKTFVKNVLNKEDFFSLKTFLATLKSDYDFIRVVVKTKRELSSLLDFSEYENIKFILDFEENTPIFSIKETKSNKAQFVEWAEANNLEKEVISLGLEFLKDV